VLLVVKNYSGSSQASTKSKNEDPVNQKLKIKQKFTELNNIKLFRNKIYE